MVGLTQPWSVLGRWSWIFALVHVTVWMKSYRNSWPFPFSLPKKDGQFYGNCEDEGVFLTVSGTPIFSFCFARTVHTTVHTTVRQLYIRLYSPRWLYLLTPDALSLFIVHRELDQYPMAFIMQCCIPPLGTGSLLNCCYCSLSHTPPSFSLPPSFLIS